MTIGTFGTVTTFVKDRDKKRKRSGKSRPSNQPGDRFKCSRCSVKTDNEDVIISHIISENDCKAGYYTDKELKK